MIYSIVYIYVRRTDIECQDISGIQSVAGQALEERNSCVLLFPICQVASRFYHQMRAPDLTGMPRRLAEKNVKIECHARNNVSICACKYVMWKLRICEYIQYIYLSLYLFIYICAFANI